MKQRPILFSTPMVQAILDGRKTMTRRVIKSEPTEDVESGYTYLNQPYHVEKLSFKMLDIHTWKYGILEFCPYGKPGDVLWVREQFKIIGTHVERDLSSGAIIEETPQYVFRGQKQPHIEKLFKWKPSIHMPKSACRIFLEVVSVKVERLQDITKSDAIKEGVERLYAGGFGRSGEEWKNYNGSGVLDSAILSFESLWESINGPESLLANPWVWVVEFKRIEKPTAV